MTPEEKIRRGHEAEAILNNAVHLEAMVAIETEVLRRIALPPGRNTPEEREWNYMLLQAQNAYRGALARFVRDGHVELMTLKDLQAESERSGDRT